MILGKDYLMEQRLLMMLKYLSRSHILGSQKRKLLRQSKRLKKIIRKTFATLIGNPPINMRKDLTKELPKGEMIYSIAKQSK